MLFYFDTIFFLVGAPLVRSFCYRLFSTRCVLFSERTIYGTRTTKKKYETQKLKKNENYERMNEMQTRDDRNEMNEPTK